MWHRVIALHFDKQCDPHHRSFVNATQGRAGTAPVFLAVGCWGAALACLHTTRSFCTVVAWRGGREAALAAWGGVHSQRAMRGGRFAPPHAMHCPWPQILAPAHKAKPQLWLGMRQCQRRPWLCSHVAGRPAATCHAAWRAPACSAGSPAPKAGAAAAAGRGVSACAGAPGCAAAAAATEGGAGQGAASERWCAGCGGHRLGARGPLAGHTLTLRIRRMHHVRLVAQACLLLPVLACSVPRQPGRTLLGWGTAKAVRKHCLFAGPSGHGKGRSSALTPVHALAMHAFPLPLTPSRYADRSSMSTAIMPMSEQYDWSKVYGGTVLSSFLLGYGATQVRATGPRPGRSRLAAPAKHAYCLGGAQGNFGCCGAAAAGMQHSLVAQCRALLACLWLAGESTRLHPPPPLVHRRRWRAASCLTATAGVLCWRVVWRSGL